MTKHRTTIAVVVGAAIAVAGMLYLLLGGSDGVDYHARCQAAAEKAMRQAIADVKAGTETADDKPSPDCLKLPVKERAAIMADVLKRYGPEWGKAIADSVAQP